MSVVDQQKFGDVRKSRAPTGLEIYSRSQVDSEFEDQDRLIVASVQRVGVRWSTSGGQKSPRCCDTVPTDVAAVCGRANYPQGRNAVEKGRTMMDIRQLTSECGLKCGLRGGAKGIRTPALGRKNTL